MPDPNRSAAARRSYATRLARNPHSFDHFHSPEIRAKAIAWRKDPERAAAADVKARRTWEKRGYHLRMRAPHAAAKASRKAGPCVTNVHAMDWHLRDPSGAVHHFRNLADFIRTHPELFTQEQLQLRKRKGKYRGATLPRVYNALASLRPGSAHTVTSSHGWTWVWYPGERDPRTVSPENKELP